MSRTRVELDAAAVGELLRAALGSQARVASAAPLGGGTFNACWEVALASGETLVLKVAPPPTLTLLTYEQDLLRTEVDFYARAAAAGVPVPRVVATAFERRAFRLRAGADRSARQHLARFVQCDVRETARGRRATRRRTAAFRERAHGHRRSLRARAGRSAHAAPRPLRSVGWERPHRRWRDAAARQRDHRRRACVPRRSAGRKQLYLYLIMRIEPATRGSGGVVGFVVQRLVMRSQRRVLRKLDALTGAASTGSGRSASQA
jgi:hypothetical protein